MTDIETRLRADAERTVAPPDFDSALRAATERRARAYRWPAAAAAAFVVVAAAATIVALRSGQHHGAPAGGTGSDLTVLGAVTAPNSSAPRQVLFVVDVPFPPDDVCPEVRADVRESATQVAVTLSVMWRPAHPLSGTVVDPLTTASAAPPSQRGPTCRSETAVVTSLGSPLGSRTMIDARTGDPIDVFTGPVPTPSYLPAGYRPWGHAYSDPMSSTTLDDRSGALSPITLSWAARTDHNERLVVVAAPSAQVIPGARVIDHVTVNGRAATVTQTTGTRCVTWTPAAGGGLQVCSDVAQINTDLASAPLLSADELVHIADSLRP